MTTPPNRNELHPTLQREMRYGITNRLSQWNSRKSGIPKNCGICTSINEHVGACESAQSDSEHCDLSRLSRLSSCGGDFLLRNNMNDQNY
ncbi:hypothetical protein ALC56_06084 [Trachymyrmex septentrionalis]|uniref:Uncharacterized protein n=1 Tax=Trachymyrmex septentrionalis TaxID=34720 RepID=A0A195FFW7_9HYME|nr:hypothetical protein ALC56_06084 [Trachymyrmex septentrionalis]